MRKDSRLLSQADLAALVGRRIQKFREERGWTRSELATLLRIQARWIEHYEGGRALPPVYTLCQLAGSFGVSVASLVDELPPEYPVGDEDLVALIRKIQRFDPSHRRALARMLTVVVENADRLVRGREV